MYIYDKAGNLKTVSAPIQIIRGAEVNVLASDRKTQTGALGANVGHSLNLAGKKK